MPKDINELHSHFSEGKKIIFKTSKDYITVVDGKKKSKHIRTRDYKVDFSMESGIEVVNGVDGKEDPFALMFPSLLDIGIMGHCENHCEICYQGDRFDDHMSYLDYISILSEAAPHVNQIALGGRGDPNHHPFFAEILFSTRMSFITPNYTTSGIDMTKAHINTSRLCGAVAVSDYGEPHTYKALEMLMEEDIKTNMHMVVHRDSFERAMDILKGKDVWDKKVNLEKLNAIIFLLFKPQGRAKRREELQLTDDQIKEFSPLFRNSKAKFQVGADSCFICKLASITGLTEKEKMFLDTCEGGRMSAYITPEMKLVPCSFGDHMDWGVTIPRTNGIREVWTKSTEFRSFRDMLREEPNKCPFGF